MLQQKIGYIDLYKGGVKCGNMGNVRLEWQAGKYRFDANLCRMDRQTIVTAIVERGGRGVDTRIKDIPIIHGKGQYQSDWIKVCGDEERMLFEASGGVYGVCVLPQMERDENDAGALQEEASPKGEETSRAETVSKGESALQAETSSKGEGVSQAETAAKGEGTLRVEVSSKGESTLRAETAAEEMRGQDGTDAPAKERSRETAKAQAKEQEQDLQARNAYEKRVSSLSDDKWKQLCRMYEVVHPIDAEIDFLKITPEDFVILRQEFQGLVRNSFLLHGYYNYDHILLGKYPDAYYIGVPGIMHEQERMAAAMFGFVGFERAGAQPETDSGDFGYYMMEVGI